MPRFEPTDASLKVSSQTIGSWSTSLDDSIWMNLFYFRLKNRMSKMWQVEFFHWNTIWHFLFRLKTNNSNRQISKNKNLIFGWISIFVTNFIFCQIFGHFGSISLKNADVMLLGRLKQKVTGMRDLKPFLWVIVANNRIITSRRSVEMPFNW